VAPLSLASLRGVTTLDLHGNEIAALPETIGESRESALAYPPLLCSGCVRRHIIKKKRESGREGENGEYVMRVSLTTFGVFTHRFSSNCPRYPAALMGALRELDLSGNPDLAALPPSIGRCAELRRVDLRGTTVGSPVPFISLARHVQREVSVRSRTSAPRCSICCCAFRCLILPAAPLPAAAGCRAFLRSWPSSTRAYVSSSTARSPRSSHPPVHFARVTARPSASWRRRRG